MYDMAGFASIARATNFSTYGSSVLYHNRLKAQQLPR